MEYPAELLPKRNYKIIQASLNGYALIRRSDKGEIFDPSTGKIKNEYIVPLNFLNRHFLNWSCNLYGPFQVDYFKFKITEKSFNEYWTEGEEISAPLIDRDFSIDNEFSYYFLHIGQILENLKIPYDRDYGGRIEKDQIAVPILVHCPTLCNFWHFEIRWKNDEGEIINPKKKSKWVKSIYNSIKNAIRQYCKPSPDSSTSTEVPSHFYYSG